MVLIQTKWTFLNTVQTRWLSYFFISIYFIGKRVAEAFSLINKKENSLICDICEITKLARPPDNNVQTFLMKKLND